MLILADESAAGYLVEQLRADGHAVSFVAELSPGDSDDTVLASAVASDSVLLTADKDFGELVFRLGRSSAGVVLCRLAGLSEHTQCELISQAFREHGHLLAGAFTVISPGAVRVRTIS